MDGQGHFTDWFFNHFAPKVKRYLESKPMDLKALLLLDNMPSYPSSSVLGNGL